MSKKILLIVFGKGRRNTIVLIVVIFLIALLFPLIASPNIIYYTVIGLIGAVLALGLNVFFGYCGQINFGCAGFFAVGAYSGALLEKYFNFPFFVNIIIAAILTGLVTWVVSYFLLQLRHHTLGLGTLAFSLVVYTVVSKGFTDITRGEDGIDLAHLTIFGSKMGDEFFYYTLLIIVGLCYWLNHALRHSRIGRAMIGMGQNETAVLSLGVNINNLFLLGLLLNGIISGLVGALYVKWIGWCSPEYFNIMTNVIILLSVVVGGIGSPLGAVIGGIFMYILPQLVIGFAKYQTLVYGIILLVFIRFLPKGIVGEINSIVFRFRNRGER